MITDQRVFRPVLRYPYHILECHMYRQSWDNSCMDKPPTYTAVTQNPARRSISRLIFSILVVVVYLTVVNTRLLAIGAHQQTIPFHAAETLQKCHSIHQKAGPPLNFHSRTQSDRFVSGTRPTLLRNASIWTGGEYNSRA